MDQQYKCFHSNVYPNKSKLSKCQKWFSTAFFPLFFLRSSGHYIFICVACLLCLLKKWLLHFMISIGAGLAAMYFKSSWSFPGPVPVSEFPCLLSAWLTLSLAGGRCSVRSDNHGSYVRWYLIEEVIPWVPPPRGGYISGRRKKGWPG